MTTPGTGRRALLGRVREYLTMARALEARRDEGARAEASDAAGEARQKRDAAEVLLLRGSLAEALRLGGESLERVRRAVAALERAGIQLGPSLQRAVARVEQQGAALGAPPALDAAVTSAQRAALRGLLREELALDRRLHVELLGRRGLLRLRRQRWVLLALVVLAPVPVAALVRSALYGIHVRASSELDEEYAADRAVDGDPDTAWIPTGGADQWLELRFPARRVHSLAILNGDTLPDRASRELHVECYFNGDLYPFGTRAFETQYPARWMEFDGAGILCDRLRIVVSTHFGAGGAIAEVTVH